MLHLIDVEVLSGNEFSVVWSSSIPVSYFVLQYGYHPSDLKTRVETNINKSKLVRPSTLLTGDIYFRLESWKEGSEKPEEVLVDRIVHKEAIRFYKYRKLFERNFLAASLKKSAGTRLAVLQKKRSGELCSCTNTLTGESTTTFCTKCYNTGYIGGFYPVRVVPALRAGATSQEESSDVNNSNRIIQQFITVPYPRLLKGDYVVDLDTKIYYEIVQEKNEIVSLDYQKVGNTTYATLQQPVTAPITSFNVTDVLPEVKQAGFKRITLTSGESVPVLVFTGLNLVHDGSLFLATILSADLSIDACFLYEDIVEMSDEKLSVKIPEECYNIIGTYKVQFSSMFWEGNLTNE